MHLDILDVKTHVLDNFPRFDISFFLAFKPVNAPKKQIALPGFWQKS